jgi:hypothetical protein
LLLRDLALPYQFTVNSAKGDVEAFVYKTPSKQCFKNSKEFIISVPKLALFDECSGDSTIDSIKERIKNYK